MPTKILIYTLILVGHTIFRDHPQWRRILPPAGTGQINYNYWRVPEPSLEVQRQSVSLHVLGQVYKI